MRTEFTKKSVVEDVNVDVNEDFNENVDRVDGYEQDEENVDEHVDRVDKMMEGVEDELGNVLVFFTC